jgi:glycosyltransferase involved in cell wall biosynthesis
MRILFVTQIIPFPPHGGVLQRGYNLLRELGSEHDVHLLAFHHPDELAPGEPLERSRAELGRFCREIEYFPLWVKKSALHKLVAFGLGAVYPKPFSVLAQKSGALAKRIATICNSAKPPDIVHLDTIALAPLREACGKVPVVLGHHNIESQLMARRAPHETGALARAYVEAQTRRLLAYEREQAGRFRLNITVSDADSAMLKSICPAAKAAAIPNGVDTNYFTPRVGDDAPAVIYTGGMNMFANRDAVEWFLDAIWPRIRAKIPDARFFAVGTKPSQKVLDAAAANIGVEAPGFVDDVRPWVARAGVYVVPLRVGGGTRLKMVDAMAQGKAIVATPVGAEGIDGRDGEEFLLRAEPDAFADTVVRLLGDKAERARLGRNARLRAEGKYAWPILGRELASLYSRVIADKP